jgi:hypothetical protein
MYTMTLDGMNMVDMHRLHYFKNERLLNDRTDAQTGREIVLRAAVGSRE